MVKISWWNLNGQYDPPNFANTKKMRNKLRKQKFTNRNMKTFDKTKYLNDIKELDNLNLYQ